MGAAAPAWTQTGGREPLQLGALQREARAADARTREIDLLAKQTELRDKNLDAEHWPSLSTLGQTQYQSDAPTSPFNGPNGQPAFVSPLFTYDLSLRVDQRIYDPASQARRDLARADLAESQARVRSSLFAVRQEVNDAFFAAALLQEQIGVLDATIADYEARLSEANARVREGAAVPADAAAVEASLLQQRQQAECVAREPPRRAAPSGNAHGPRHRSRRAGTAARSAHLGRAGARGADARAGASGVRAVRPSARPRITSAGAHPGLRSPPAVGLWPRRIRTPGARFHQRPARMATAWAACSSSGRRGTGTRPRASARRWRCNRRSSTPRKRHSRAASAARSKPTWLRSTISETAIPTDDRIVSLREGIDRTARVRLGEGVITASEYLDRHTEWLTAQFEQARHRVELAQASARVLTTLGLEVQ